MRRKTKIAIVSGTTLLLVLIALALFLNRHEIANGMMIAGAKRAMQKHVAVPVDLTTSYARSASDFENSSSFWGEVPWGFQVFNGVPLQIDGIIYLWGAGNAKAGNNFPEEVLGIGVNERFETLYLYHCTFYGSGKGTPVYDLVFRYEDGESVTNTIRYGFDTVDFNTPGGKNIKGPSGPNSRTAWIGSSFSDDGKHPLLFSLTGVTNSRPSVKVATIDLFSSKNQSAGVIFAMTAGTSKLMK